MLEEIKKEIRAAQKKRSEAWASGDDTHPYWTGRIDAYRHAEALITGKKWAGPSEPVRTY